MRQIDMSETPYQIEQEYREAHSQGAKLSSPEGPRWCLQVKHSAKGEFRGLYFHSRQELKECLIIIQKLLGNTE